MDKKYQISINANVITGVMLGHFEYEDAVDLVNERKKLGKGQKVLLLSDIRKAKSGSKEAKNYLGTEEAAEDVIANAILVNNYTSKMIGNIFLIFQKPAVPVRLFTSEEKALDWLTSFK